MAKNQTVVAQTFLYRWRFVLAYSVLALAFTSLIVVLPFISPSGISQDEMRSAVSAYELKLGSFSPENIINLPFLLLQKLSIHLFGMSAISVKLPSIILAFFSGLLIILLLTHWFKKNVAIIASGLMFSAGVFLTVAGRGTPDIMYIFWPALILWLGFKVMHDKKSLDIYDVALYVALALSLYTPYMVYAVIAMVITVLAHPHLRFLFKQLPQFMRWIALAVAAITLVPLIISTIFHFNYNVVALTFGPDTDMKIAFTSIPENLRLSFRQLFSFQAALDSPIVTPGFGLPMFILSGVGFLALFKTRHSAKNYFLYLWLIFVAIVMALAPAGLSLIILPATILVAAGVGFVLERWYGIFPFNPFARVLGLLPISLLVSTVALSNLQFFIYGGLFVPQIANYYNQDLELIKQNVNEGSLILLPDNSFEYRFYRSISRERNISVETNIPEDFTGEIVMLSPTIYDADYKRPNIQLSRIVTSNKSQNSDRLYIYSLESTASSETDSAE